jgi:TonB family protein
VFGYLFDPLGAPLDGVTLALERGRFYGSSTTDQTGRYEFRKLQPGLYSFYAPTVEMVEPLTLRLSAGDEVHHDVYMKITPLVGSFTVCAECVVRTDNYQPPDSLAKEIEQDRREWAQKQVVTGPEPIGGWETLHATIPDYPEYLERKKLEGSVVIEGVIGTDGFRTKMRIVSAAHPDLAKAALELLRNEQWQPARVRGLAFEVPFREQIEFVLRLPER